ncbi:MAG: hypothetical protein V4576_04245 [Patescibacteria group bacterium]
MRINFLGLAGTVQTGKSELASVFEDCGWKFLDLNDPQCDLRAKGTDRYNLFPSGSLKECGSKTGQFYDLVSPEFYQARVAEDSQLLVPIILEWCANAAPQPVVLSWEFLPSISDRIQLDHTLYCVSNLQIWMERLHTRLKGRGMTGEIPDERIWHVIDVLNVWPDKIAAAVQEKMAGNFTEFDVSAPDWGESELRPWLAQVRG